MTAIAICFSVFVIALGIVGLVSPSRLLAFDAYFQKPPGLYAAAVIRLVVGVALFAAAPESRAPGTLQILGIVIIMAGFITIVLGFKRFRHIAGWWSTQGPATVRTGAGVAVAFGLLLAYALLA